MSFSREVFPSLIKNDNLKSALSGSLSHAYIIEGTKGSGRLTAARNAAAAVLCECRDDRYSDLPCGECSVCSRIFRGIHPDVIEVDTGDKKTIGVDTVRMIRSQVFVAPSESERKFFIIKDADLMTPEAQNALLISLEEPPEFSVFFLLATDSSLLLETIRSRCVTLTTEKLDADTMSQALRNYPEGEKLNAESLERLVTLADGSLGETLRLIREGSAEEDEHHSLAEKTVRTILTGTGTEKVALAAIFPKSKDSADKIFTLAITAIRDIISIKNKTAAPLLFYKCEADASSLTSCATPKLMKLYGIMEDAHLALSGNASLQLTAERVIMAKL